MNYNTYNPEFVAKNQMGPNSLWLMEWLTEKIKIKKNMKILDLAGFNIFPSVEETLLKDAGKYIGFVRIVDRKNKAKTQESMPHPWQSEFSAVCDSIFKERDGR